MREPPMPIVKYEPVPDDPDLGKAMAELSPRQRAFVFAYVADGKGSATAAARASGYGETDGAQRVQAHRLIHNPKILAAIKELADGRLRSYTYRAANALIEIADDVTHKDRFRAADTLLNRAGLLVATVSTVEHIHKTEKRSDILDRINEIAKRNGVDPTALLHAATAPQLTGPAEVVMSSEGLEDLL